MKMGGWNDEINNNFRPTNYCIYMMRQKERMRIMMGLTEMRA